MKRWWSWTRSLTNQQPFLAWRGRDDIQLDAWAVVNSPEGTNHFRHKIELAARTPANLPAGRGRVRFIASVEQATENSAALSERWRSLGERLLQKPLL